MGERLARLALHNDYGFNIEPSGPLFKAVTKASASSLSLCDPIRANGRRSEPLSPPSVAQEVVVTFEYGDGLRPSNGTEVVGFELAGKDMLYHKATCRLEGDRAVLSAPEVKDPVYVRYAWEPYTRANLVNAAGLPASTFLSLVK